MNDDTQTDRSNDQQPESAEGEQASEVSEEMPEEVSGEGATPLGSSDQYSSAPGPHGLGPVTDDPDDEDDSPGLAPLEKEAE